ncbi:hypothetical protein PTE30175_04091 [Pandoraea terrae]|uniref:Uncharacterized protein n=1 Tax=Pandoraea terrae TaxID=1537710 RepID=A0A5E4XZ73_9BURK|nr:hypothetical protein [Pandoraea terrae]VVE41640.1 hypothetical protein PTE30175_04091 [Pandoraea terrae]
MLSHITNAQACVGANVGPLQAVFVFVIGEVVRAFALRLAVGKPASARFMALGAKDDWTGVKIWVEEDGKPSYAGKRFAAMNDPEMFAELRKTCVTKGASVGPNPQQRKIAASDLIEFLDETIGK